MTTSKAFLATASSALDPTLLQSKPAQRIAEWCLEYYRANDVAPCRNIEAVYYAWAESGESSDTEAEAVHDLLEFLSGEFDRAGELNIPHLLDEMGRYITIRSLARLQDSLAGALAGNDREAAEELVTSYTSPLIGQGVGFDPLTDRAAWHRAFADPQEPLIRFPGDVGRFLNAALTRDALIAVQGPEKSGKTHWCVEFAMRALRCHRKVALFEVGDLSESQIMLRLGVRLSGLPLWKDQCGEVPIPFKLTHRPKEEMEVDERGAPRVDVSYKYRDCKQTVSYKACRRACRKYLRACGITREHPGIMVSVHPNTSISVGGIDIVLRRWRQERGFVPDVVIIDYADILAPEETSGRFDFRHQVNETWKALRRLSQEWHALVVTPTQADAASYAADVQSMRNFSEDKRKMAHVTGVLGLNQTDREKEIGVQRLNWIILRESGFISRRCLHVGQCLSLGHAFTCGVL